MVVLSIQLRGSEQRVTAITADLRQLLAEGHIEVEGVFQTLGKKHPVEDVSYVVSRMMASQELLMLGEIFILARAN